MTPNQLIKQLWDRQEITAGDVDYSLWKEKKQMLASLGHFYDSCLFTVDVYKGCYNFASDNFTNVFGIKPLYLQRIEKQGDMIQELIHPDDREAIKEIQIEHGHFIYSLPIENRNDYQTIYQFRMLNARKEYVNIVSRQRVLMQDRNGKAWIIIGNMSIAPDQLPGAEVKHSALNIRTGEIVTPAGGRFQIYDALTAREKEVLKCLAQGMFGKEIAGKLGISLNTVNNHRKSILAKLHVDNSIEAINRARQARILD